MPPFSRIFRLFRLPRQRRTAENAVDGLPTNLQPGEMAWGNEEQKLYVGSEEYPALPLLIGGPGMTLDEVTPPVASVDFNEQNLVNLADPVNPQDAATKFYVDATATGLDVKKSCRAATTGNITLSGLQTVDGVALAAGNRVLVKNQTNKTENGIYVAAASAWSRAEDADSDDEITAGMFTFVEEGSLNLDSGWVLIANQPVILGSTNLEFSLFSVATPITPGDGLTKDGDTLNVNTADSARIVVNSDNIDLATTGVTADTYNSVTVDAYGRITAGSVVIPVIGVGSGTGSIVGQGLNNTALGNYSVVPGGEYNTAAGVYSFIGGGQLNTANDVYNVVTGGRQNKTVMPSSFVGGGAYNTASAYYAVVTGGKLNAASGTAAVIAGGQSNTTNGNWAAVNGGNLNIASGTGSVVGGGTFNTVIADKSAVSGGHLNVSSGVASFVGGGSSNNATGLYAAVAGGTGNFATAAYSAVGGGRNAKAAHYGSSAHAAGSFANSGDAQKVTLIARNSTTNATLTELFLDGESLRAVIPAETTWRFDIKLSAYSSTSAAGAAWSIRGAIRRNNANSTVLIGSNVTEDWTEAALSGVAVTVVADDTNKALAVKVTGLASNSIRWVAAIELTQVSAAAP